MHPHISSHASLAISALCAIVPLCFIITHTCARYYFLGRLYLSDLFLLSSWVLFFPHGTLFRFLVASWGFDDPRLQYSSDGGPPKYELYVEVNHIQDGLKLYYSGVCLTHCAMLAMKLVFLLTYGRLFPPSMRKLRIALFASTLLVLLGYVVVIGLNLFWCLPVWQNWSLDPRTMCMATVSFIPYYFTVIFHVTTDLIIYILPFFLISTLTTMKNPEERCSVLGVRIMFSLGFVCIFITAVRIWITFVGASGPTIAAMYAAEMAAPQIVACLPMVRRLVQDLSMRQKSEEGLRLRPRLGVTTVDELAVVKVASEGSQTGSLAERTKSGSFQ